MKILVTGGTGVIGAGTLPELLRAGHTIRLLSRGADKAAEEYPNNIESFPADITRPETLRGAADGCDVVLHIAGIVEEQPPERTFENINVRGTENIVQEAERGGAGRFIYVSSLGADLGESEYHRSKRRAEEIVKRFRRSWLILRPGNVYGPGDAVISKVLKMIRTLPVMPVVGGEKPFEPVWFRDLGRAIERAVADRSIENRILEVTSNERTTPRELIDAICRITDRHPAQVDTPTWLAKIGTKMAERFGGLGQRLAAKTGAELPASTATLQMLEEENVVHSPEGNALTAVFQIEPTPLEEGLRELADELPELMLEEGVGRLEFREFKAEIQGGKLSAAELMKLFRERLPELVPVEFEAEPGANTRPEKGATMTGKLPLRGHFQVRVEDLTPESLTMVTLEGHPMAGVISFRAREIDCGLRFSIQIYERAANIFDWLALHTVGAHMQKQNWKGLIERVIELSGGKAPRGVQHRRGSVEDEQAEKVEEWERDLVTQRKREEAAFSGDAALPVERDGPAPAESK